MHSWINPFAGERDVTSSSKPLELDNRLCIQENFLLSVLEKESALGPALEGGVQLPQHDADASELVNYGECSSEYEDQDQVECSRTTDALTSSMTIVPTIDENNLAIRYFENEVFDASKQCEDLNSERPVRFAKETFAFSNNLKGPLKKKSKFSFHSASRSFQMKGPYNEVMDKDRNITIAERLKTLTESADSQIYRVDDLSKRLECKAKSASSCVPMAERFQELLSCDAAFPESKGKGLSRRFLTNNTAKFVGESKNTIHRRMVHADDDIAGTGNCEEDCEEKVPSAGDAIAESGNSVKDCEEKNSTWRMSSQVSENPVAQSMNERFQEALLAASCNDQNSYIHDKPKGSVFGFAARLQRVLQHEKSERCHFMRALQMRQKFCYATQCLEVKIATKSLEARLISCTCEVVKPPEHWLQWPNRSSLEKRDMPLVTVIFNTRTNQDLELEVGRSVRIHPPWREVSASQGLLKIILCTYFCEILTTYEIGITADFFNRNASME